MWASSCWNLRTLVSPVSAPDSSLRWSTPKSARRTGNSFHDRGRWSNIKLTSWHTPNDTLISAMSTPIINLCKVQKKLIVIPRITLTTLNIHCLKKTSPFLFLWYLSQISSNSANFWQKHGPGNLKQTHVHAQFKSRFLCSYCTL